MKKGILVLMVIAMCAALAFTGCSQANTTTSAPAATQAPATSAPAATTAATTSAPAATTASKKYTIAVVPKLIGIPYFEASRAGVEQAGKDLGVNAVFNGPSQADAAQQVQVIQDLISQGVNAIAVSANDANSLTPVLTQAKNAGITVLDWDSAADQSIVQLSVREIDYQTFAKSTWDELVKAMGTDTGDYAILTSTLTADSCNQWIKFGKEYAAQKYPGLKLVTDPVCTNEDAQQAYTKTLDLVTTYPKLKGIIGFSSPAPIGAAKAIDELKKNGKIAVVGSALPNDSKQYLKDGAMSAALLWDPTKLGYLTVYLADYLLQGKTVKDGNMDVPNVGTVTVSGKEVVLGPPTVFTKDNVDKYNF